MSAKTFSFPPSILTEIFFYTSKTWLWTTANNSFPSDSELFVKPPGRCWSQGGSGRECSPLLHSHRRLPIAEELLQANGEQVESINLFGPTRDFSFLLLPQPTRQCSLPLLPRGTHEWQLTSHARRIPSGGSYSPSCFQLLGLPVQILQHHPGWQLLCYHTLVVFWFCGR